MLKLASRARAVTFARERNSQMVAIDCALAAFRYDLLQLLNRSTVQPLLVIRPAERVYEDHLVWIILHDRLRQANGLVQIALVAVCVNPREVIGSKRRIRFNLKSLAVVLNRRVVILA